MTTVLGILVLAAMAFVCLIVVPIGAVFLTAMLNRRNCERCGYKLPWRRKPANRQQAMFGGWTCPGCGADLDRDGRVRVA